VAGHVSREGVLYLPVLPLYAPDIVEAEAYDAAGL
jgi:hypothetical protein